MRQRGGVVARMLIRRGGVNNPMLIRRGGVRGRMRNLARGAVIEKEAGGIESGSHGVKRFEICLTPRLMVAFPVVLMTIVVVVATPANIIAVEVVVVLIPAVLVADTTIW